MSLEDYLVGVVAAEMPASFADEALKAQAISARTYALYKKENSQDNYDVVTTVANQSYITFENMKSKWNDDFDFYYNKIKEAVKETENMVIKNEGKLICSYYFAISNGYTEDSVSVFGEKKYYLQSEESLWDKEVSNYEKTITISKEVFCDKLKINCNPINIKNIIKSSTNHIESITINDNLYSGIKVRQLLELRSTDFDIVINNEDIKITTRGYGHGVGMSQYGANEMAKKGYSYEEILKYYYHNTEITKI